MATGFAAEMFVVEEGMGGCDDAVPVGSVWGTEVLFPKSFESCVCGPVVLLPCQFNLMIAGGIIAFTFGVLPPSLPLA